MSKQAEHTITLSFDGGCDPNPGSGAWGFVLESEAMRLCGYGWFGRNYQATNNRAEYEALLQGVGALAMMQTGSGTDADLFTGDVHLVVRGDSQLVIRQMQGEWKSRQPALTKYRDRALALVELQRFASVCYEWVPRCDNTEADELSTMGLDLADDRYGSHTWTERVYAAA